MTRAGSPTDECFDMSTSLCDASVPGRVPAPRRGPALGPPPSAAPRDGWCGQLDEVLAPVPRLQTQSVEDVVALQYRSVLDPSSPPTPPVAPVVGICGGAGPGPGWKRYYDGVRPRL